MMNEDLVDQSLFVYVYHHSRDTTISILRSVSLNYRSPCTVPYYRTVQKFNLNEPKVKIYGMPFPLLCLECDDLLPAAAVLLRNRIFREASLHRERVPQLRNGAQDGNNNKAWEPGNLLRNNFGLISFG